MHRHGRQRDGCFGRGDVAGSTGSGAQQMSLSGDRLLHGDWGDIEQTRNICNGHRLYFSTCLTCGATEPTVEGKPDAANLPRLASSRAARETVDGWSKSAPALNRQGRHIENNPRPLPLGIMTDPSRAQDAAQVAARGVRRVRARGRGSGLASADDIADRPWSTIPGRPAGPNVVDRIASAVKRALDPTAQATRLNRTGSRRVLLPRLRRTAGASRRRLDDRCPREVSGCRTRRCSGRRCTGHHSPV